MTRWLSILALVFLLSPLTARAAGSASLSLSVDARAVAAGQAFSVAVWVRPNGESLDTVRAYLTFSPEYARVTDIALGTAFPRVSPGNGFDNALGTVSIGAFSLDGAVREPGVLATVTFEALAAGDLEIDVGSSSRLIANGEERASASGHTGVAVQVGEAAGVPPSPGAASAEPDLIPPNPIVPYTPRIRYVEGEDALLEFGTTDDGSGMSHYEVSVNDGAFVRATSPYVLSGLPVGDLFIEVKAVDVAGNERFGKTGVRVYPRGTELKPEDAAAREEERRRIAELAPVERAPGADRLLITLVSASVVILAIIGAVLYRRRGRVS